MSFLLLIVVASVIAWGLQRLLSGRADRRDAMRFGLAAALLFTGTDHFANDTIRYLPMMPAFFGPAALPLVWFTGAAEIAGALGLALPLAAWRQAGLPNLRPAAGVALALLFLVMVVANIHMAIQGTDVAGLEFGRTYLLVRPFLQPVFVIWALYAGGVIGRRTEAACSRRRRWRMGRA